MAQRVPAAPPPSSVPFASASPHHAPASTLRNRQARGYALDPTGSPLASSPGSGRRLRPRPAPHPAVASPAACDSFRAFGSWKEDLSVRRFAEGPSALVCLMVIAHARSRGALAVWRAGRGSGVPSHHSL